MCRRLQRGIDPLLGRNIKDATGAVGILMKLLRSEVVGARGLPALRPHDGSDQPVLGRMERDLVAVWDEVVEPFGDLQCLDILPLCSGSDHCCPQVVIGWPQRLDKARCSIHVTPPHQIPKRLANGTALIEVRVLLGCPVEQLSHLLGRKIALTFEVIRQLLWSSCRRSRPLRSSDRLRLT